MACSGISSEPGTSKKSMSPSPYPCLTISAVNEIRHRSTISLCNRPEQRRSAERCDPQPGDGSDADSWLFLLQRNPSGGVRVSKDDTPCVRQNLPVLFHPD